MSETKQVAEQTNVTSAAGRREGFFGRLIQKLDDSMKQKAEKNAEQSSCCGGSDGKGGKCC